MATGARGPGRERTRHPLFHAPNRHPRYDSRRKSLRHLPHGQAVRRDRFRPVWRWRNSEQEESSKRNAWDSRITRIWAWRQRWLAVWRIFI